MDLIAWCEDVGIRSIAQVQPLHVAAWVELQTREHAALTAKLRLAAVRHLFDWLVTGQIVPVNPAASRPRYAELQVTSHFSFLRGASSCEELFTQAAYLGIEALAITDRNSVRRLFQRFPEALDRTHEIMDRCKFSLDELSYQYRKKH